MALEALREIPGAGVAEDAVVEVDVVDAGDAAGVEVVQAQRSAVVAGAVAVAASDDRDGVGEVGVLAAAAVDQLPTKRSSGRSAGSAAASVFLWTRIG